MPSAADEEWYSSKRPSSTVAVNRSELNAKMSTFFFCKRHLSLLAELWMVGHQQKAGWWGQESVR